jgi:predicted kinase
MPERRNLYVVVSGPPGSGKSTIASVIAARFALPLLAKDSIKEILFDTIGALDVAASRRLGAASIRTLLAIARDNGCAVIDSTWRAGAAVDDLRALPGPIVEVFCACPSDVARARYAARAALRHPGHFDTEHLEANDLWSGEIAEPVDGGWPVVRLDTSRAVDADNVCARIARVVGAT